MAIKKREHAQPAAKDITTDMVEKFAAAADGGSVKTSVVNPSAIRDYKAMRVPFNQFEYEQLEIGATITGRSKLNFIRFAILKLVKELQEK